MAPTTTKTQATQSIVDIFIYLTTLRHSLNTLYIQYSLKPELMSSFCYNFGMDSKFGGVIWTNHALEKLKERGIKQSDAWATWRNPQQSRRARIPGAWVYYRTYGNEKIEVVAKKNEKGEWVILSVWSRPVFKESGNESFWAFLLKKIFGRS